MWADIHFESSYPVGCKNARGGGALKKKFSHKCISCLVLQARGTGIVVLVGECRHQNQIGSTMYQITVTLIYMCVLDFNNQIINYHLMYFMTRDHHVQLSLPLTHS